MCFILKIIYTFVSLLMLVLFLLFPCPANREACQESGPSFILTNSVVSGTQGKKKISLLHFYLLMIIVTFFIVLNSYIFHPYLVIFHQWELEFCSITSIILYQAPRKFFSILHFSLMYGKIMINSHNDTSYFSKGHVLCRSQIASV